MKEYKRVIHVLQSIVLVAVLMISVSPAALAGGINSPVTNIGVAAGGQHSMLLKSDGTVWVWGRNNYGQLGNGTTTDQINPIQVSGLTNVKVIAACANQSFAVKTDGTVWAWGQNNYGQLGDGTKTDRSTPVQVAGLTGVTAVAAGPRQTFALGATGTVWSWGQNNHGQLGDSTRTDKVTPVKLSWYCIIAIATGGDPVYGDNHTLMMYNGGVIYGWGTNACGELYYSAYSDLPNPSGIPVNDVTAIAAGARQSYALKSDHTVWAWGDNSYGCLGTGSMTPASSASPVKVGGVLGNGSTDITELKACGSHCFALTSNGEIWGWGENASGELGNGSYERCFSSPTQTELEGATALATGSHHSIALKSDGTVWAWGANFYGQLGDGTRAASAMPVHVRIPDEQAGQAVQSGGLTLAAQTGTGCIHLNWNAAGDSSVVGYHLYKGTSSGTQSQTPETDFAITGTSYDDTKIQSGATYYYILKPVLQDGSEGTLSNEASAAASSGGTIVLTLGSPMMTVNGVSKEIDPGKGTVPAVVNQRTFIPIRAVIEEMGGTAGWDQAEQKVTITLGSSVVELWIGSTAIRVNGVQTSMDVTPYVSSTCRTMLPVRFVTESLGLNVDWNSVDQSVTIYYQNSAGGGSQTDTAGGTAAGTDTASASWAGSWSTEWGDMTLHQTGNSVSGTYLYSDETYSISGTASGNTLTGTFDEGNGYTGVFQFTLSSDGRSFSGRWHYDAEAEWSGWSGTRE